VQYFKRPGAIKALVANIKACNATWPSELLVNVDDKQDAGRSSSSSSSSSSSRGLSWLWGQCKQTARVSRSW
jgi:hypothetical protein